MATNTNTTGDVLQDEFDAFLNEATHTLAQMYAEMPHGRRLDSDELCDLNDAIESFFESRRSLD